MSINIKERLRNRELFSQMTSREKLDYIWLYFKWHILLGIAAVAILASSIYGAITAKEPVLYVGYLNVAVGEELESRLSGGYLTARELDPQKKELVFYQDLYLTSDPFATDQEYAYSSRMKVMATITSQQLDMVLMNREAYNLASESGYLLELDTLFGDDPEISPLLVSNTVIPEDDDGESIAVTETVVNGLVVTDVPLFRQAGFSGDVYVGIIVNTPRLSDCASWLTYLVSAE